MKVLIPIGLLIVALGVAFAVVPQKEVDSWALENLTVTDRLLCDGKQEAGQFFVARTDGHVKVGSLLGVDEGLGRPLPFIASVRFKNQDGEAIGTAEGPEVLVEEYVKIDGEYFAKSVTNYSIYQEGLKSLHVEFLLKRYTDTQAMPGKENLDDSELELVFECRSEWDEARP